MCETTVTINYEDREQVERLTVAYYGLPKVGNVDQMQAALREFANPKPPKPEEPTGLGAVVGASAYTDTIRPFVRCASDRSPWMDEGGNGHDWAELAVVRVLSEGVTS